jgi:nicotinamide mononucleotide adenylyltransferase
MHQVGVTHGRFQVLHHDHLKYLLAGKARCRHLVVGITNPDPSHTRDDPADPQRSSLLANPLTYLERHQLAHSALVEAGVSLQDFTIVPFPINFPELYRYYLPLDAVFFLTIYDAWGRSKLSRFQEMGLKTEVLWERTLADKGQRATDIRQSMLQGQSWEHLVPPANVVLLNRWGIPERLRRLMLEASQQEVR